MKDHFNLAEIFSDCYIFESFNESDFIIAKELVEWQRIKTGQYFFREGDDCNGFFLVCSGTVEIVTQGNSHKEKLLTTVSEGNIFGEIAIFLSNGKRSASAKGKSPGVCCFFPREIFEELLQQDKPIAHKIVLALARTLAERLDKLTKQSIQLSEIEENQPHHKKNHDLMKFKDQLATLWSF